MFSKFSVGLATRSSFPSILNFPPGFDTSVKVCVSPVSAGVENVPTTVFSQPNLGTVGLPEDEARKKHGEVEIYRATFRPMKNTISGSAEQTMMKLVVAKSSQKVVGLHMVGPDAGEIVQGFAVAIKMGATKKDFDSTIGIHPTAAEELVTMRTPSSGPWQAPMKKAAE